MLQRGRPSDRKHEHAGEGVMEQSSDSPSSVLQFGAFEVDPRLGILTKQGKRLRLQEQPFQVLLMLLEKRGELVSREEIHKRLWPDTIVDFDHGLNKAINKIREVLGDSAASPRFVETVARRGYRFLADVKSLEHPAGREAEPAGTAVPALAPPGAATVVASPGASSARRHW